MAPRTLPFWAKTSRRNIFLDANDDCDSGCWQSITSSKTSLTTSSSTGHAPENLPSTAEFASNHVMVNRARLLWGVHPLYRSQHLDQLATQHAKVMASKKRVFHSTIDASELQKKLGAGCVVAGENVQRGPSIKKMHLWTLQSRNSKHRRNLQSEHFHEMGVGTCRGADGRLYMCQLFRGLNPEEWDDQRSSAGSYTSHVRAD